VVIYLFVSDDVIEWQTFWISEKQEVEEVDVQCNMLVLKLRSGMDICQKYAASENAVAIVATATCCCC